jgi:hypothetical protein
MNSEFTETQKKVYTPPELKEWGSIAEITLGHGLKTFDTDLYQTYSSVDV